MPMLRLARSARWRRFMLVGGLVVEPVLAEPLIVEQGENVQQRRFSRAGGSHDGEELALLDVEVDAAQDPGLSGSGFVTAFDIF